MQLATLSWEDMSALDAAAALGIAALIGLAVGIDREASGSVAGGPKRFAGLRTFFLIGLLGGASGLFAIHGDAIAGAVLLAGGAAFSVAAYVVAARREGAAYDATTEAAALVVLALGMLAGAGQMTIAAGAAALVLVALREKERLHGAVKHIDQVEMRAALEFAVLALVVLPLLPEGPFLASVGGVRPRSLWGLVLLFLAVDFAGYVARRAIGVRKGYGATGLIGGFVSSTLVTIQFARLSRREPANGVPLALGAIAACAVMPLRVAVITAVLSASTGRAVWPFLVIPAVTGFAAAAWVLHKTAKQAADRAATESGNPLRLWSAIQMAAIFQVSMMGVAAARDLWGTTGVIGSAVGLGMFDMDALTAAMTRLADGSTAAALAAQGIGIGVLTNTIVKLAIGLALGAGPFRRTLAFGLVLQAVACVAGLALLLRA